MLRFLFLGIVLTGVAIWLINVGWAQFILRSRLNREIQQCHKEQDLAVSVRILKRALDQYPEAPNRPAAEQLLKTCQQQLAHTEALSRIMDQAQDTPELSVAVALLKDGLDKYSEATNQAAARKFMEDLQQRKIATERLATTIHYAEQSPDPAYGIQALTQALSDFPNALNRKEAEDLLAAKKQQCAMDEILAKAMAESQQDIDIDDAIRRLETALAACPQSQYRKQAEVLLDQYKRQSDPVALAVATAKTTSDAAAGVMLLENALARYPTSSARKEAEELLTKYQRQLNTNAVDRNKDLNRLSWTPVSSAMNRYTFYPPDKVPARDIKPWQMVDSPLINRLILYHYALETELSTDTMLKVQRNDVSLSRTEPAVLRYVPRFTFSTRNNDLKAGSTLVIEYFSSKGSDKTDIRRAAVERIPMPEMAKGRTLTVDGNGMDIKVADGNRQGIEFYGAIISLFTSDGTLLMQKYSGPKLVRECSAQPPLPDSEP